MIALDIGAGNTSFGKDLRRLNPQITTVICADPYIKKDFEEYWSIGSLLEVTVHNAYAALSRLTKVSTPWEVEKVVRKSKKGIFKAIATYENTGLPDESVDILTLNSPNPLFPPSEDDFLEFHRVLKKWGIKKKILFVQFIYTMKVYLCFKFKTIYGSMMGLKYQDRE